MFYNFFNFLAFLYKSKTNQYIHSPFVFQFYNKVLIPKQSKTNILDFLKNTQKLSALKSSGSICSNDLQNIQNVIINIARTYCFNELLILEGDSFYVYDIQAGKTPFMKEKKPITLSSAFDEEMKFNGLILTNLEASPILNGPNPELLLSRFGSRTIMVVTDIYLNSKNLEAWNTLRASLYIPLSIDIYSLGILFFNPDIKQKQHFYLRA